MEFLNKIELRGIVGMTSLNRVGDSQVCRFSLVTEYSYKDRDGRQQTVSQVKLVNGFMESLLTFNIVHRDRNPAY